MEIIFIFGVIALGLLALSINAMWAKDCDAINDDWYEIASGINSDWAKECRKQNEEYEKQIENVIREIEEKKEPVKNIYDDADKIFRNDTRQECIEIIKKYLT